MKIFMGIVALVVTLSSASIMGLEQPHNNLYAHAETTEVHSHADCTGKRCSGTVGCNCPGFSPIKNGKVHQQAYCKHCGHHRRVHK